MAAWARSLRVFGQFSDKRPVMPARFFASVLALALLSPSANAQVLVKCTKKGATPVFMQEACPAGYSAAKAIAYTPDLYARPYRPNVRARPYAQRSGGQAATITMQRSTTACDVAKAQRDAHVGSSNQGGNVDARRFYNDQVAKHCYSGGRPTRPSPRLLRTP